MNGLGWNFMELIAGTGLIFLTNFSPWTQVLWKVTGCLMVMLSTYRLALLLG